MFFEYKLYPRPELRDFVVKYSVYYSSSGFKNKQKVFWTPDGLMSLFFEFGRPSSFITREGELVKPGSMIFSGNMTNYLMMSNDSRFGLIRVSFYPWGAYSFFNVPACELNGLLCGMDDILPSISSEIYEKLSSSTSPFEAVKILESIIFERISAHAYFDSGVSFLGKNLSYQNPEGLTPGLIMDTLCITERTMERKFKRYLGLNPKMFIQLVRFKYCTSELRASNYSSIEELATKTGYYDLSHLIHDFKKFIGVSPSYYLKFQKWPSSNGQNVKKDSLKK